MRLPPRAVVVPVTALTVLAVDQLSKAWIVQTLFPGESQPVIPGLLAWTFVQNHRGAYGLFGDHAWLLVALALAVLVVFALTFRDFIRRSARAAVAFGLIVGGAIGNVIDRFHYHHVVDFISVRPLPFFEVFNVADACVSVGAVVLVLLSLAEKPASASPSP